VADESAADPGLLHIRGRLPSPQAHRVSGTALFSGQATVTASLTAKPSIAPDLNPAKFGRAVGSSGKKPKLLFITQALPQVLTDGGSIRTFKIAEALAQRFDITMVGALHAAREPSASFEALTRLCQRVLPVPDAKDGSVRFYLNVLVQAALKRKPPSIAYNHNSRLEKELIRCLRWENYDVIHLNHADAGQYLRWLPQERCVIDTHNLLFDFHRKASRAAGTPWARAVHRLASRQMSCYERAVFERCSRVLVCSREEADCLRHFHLGDRISVIPNGVDCEYYQPDGTDYFRNPPVVIFTGNMGYFPNHDAAVFFMDRVLPLLRRDRPDVRFVIVGKGPSRDLQRMAAVLPDVTVTGAVGDVRPYLRMARVFVAPLRFGSGTRLKLLEAFSMGLPTVATRLGAEGIEGVNGEHLLLADDPAELASEVTRLLGDEKLHVRLSRAAHGLVRTKYDWRTIGRSLLEVYGS